MKIIIIFFSFFLGLYLLSNFSEIKIKSFPNHSKKIKIISENNITILGREDMSKLNGGCGGGGVCSIYFHFCYSPCTHIDADECFGTIGDCINDSMVMICACESYYDYINGCMYDK